MAICFYGDGTILLKKKNANSDVLIKTDDEDDFPF